MQQLIGFFRYSPFPYVVAFEIAKFDEKGRAYVKDVGWFSTDQLLGVRPLPAGRALKEVIEGIGRAYRKACADLEREFVGKVEDVLGVSIKK